MQRGAGSRGVSGMVFRGGGGAGGGGGPRPPWMERGGPGGARPMGMPGFPPPVRGMKHRGGPFRGAAVFRGRGRGGGSGW